MPQVSINIRGREKPVRRSVRAKSGVVEKILQEIGINPLDVLIKLNGEFVPDTEKARTGDRLELLEITSRG
jgi:sulfur carrier protein ThiS